MKVTSIILCLLLVMLQSAHAKVTTLYPEAKPCDPSPFGTSCTAYPKTMPYKKYKTPVYCGSTLVYLTHKQKRVIEAMLRENRNVILRYRSNEEFIDAACF